MKPTKQNIALAQIQNVPEKNIPESYNDIRQKEEQEDIEENMNPVYTSIALPEDDMNAIIRKAPFTAIHEELKTVSSLLREIQSELSYVRQQYDVSRVYTILEMMVLMFEQQSGENDVTRLIHTLIQNMTQTPFE